MRNANRRFCKAKMTVCLVVDKQRVKAPCHFRVSNANRRFAKQNDGLEIAPCFSLASEDAKQLNKVLSGHSYRRIYSIESSIYHSAIPGG